MATSVRPLVEARPKAMEARKRATATLHRDLDARIDFRGLFSSMPAYRRYVEKLAAFHAQAALRRGSALEAALSDWQSRLEGRLFEQDLAFLGGRVLSDAPVPDHVSPAAALGGF